VDPSKHACLATSRSYHSSMTGSSRRGTQSLANAISIHQNNKPHPKNTLSLGKKHATISDPNRNGNLPGLSFSCSNPFVFHFAGLPLASTRHLSLILRTYLGCSLPLCACLRGVFHRFVDRPRPWFFPTAHLHRDTDSNLVLDCLSDARRNPANKWRHQ